MRLPQSIKVIAQAPLCRVIARESARIASGWVLLFTAIIGPVLVFLLVSIMFSAGVVRNLPVTVVDLDHTQMSRRIARMADALPAANVVSKSASLPEARAMMMNGEADAVLVLPEGMEKSVQKGEQAEAVLYLNNTNVVKGGVLQSQLSAAFSSFSAGIKVQSMVKKGIPPGEAIRRAMPVRPDIHLLFNPYGNYAYFLMMGLLPLLAVVFIFLGTSYTIGMEMKAGTSADWIQTANGNYVVALIGKLIPYMLLFFADMMVLNILLIRVMGVPVNGSLTAILLSEFLLILAYMAMAILLLTLTINLRLTLSLGSAYTMMALTFSGLTFPVSGMPLAGKIFSLIFPYTFMLKIFLGQSLRGEPVHEILLPMIILILFILTALLSFPVFKRRVDDERWRTKE